MEGEDTVSRYSWGNDKTGFVFTDVQMIQGKNSWQGFPQSRLTFDL